MWELGGRPTGRASSHASAACEAQRDAAKRAYERSVLDLSAEVTVMSDVYDWSRRWLEQDLALANDDDARAAAIQAHLARMEQLARREFRHVEKVEYYLTEAEAMLAELRP